MLKKIMKQLISAALAVTMVFAAAVDASAAGTSGITVTSVSEKPESLPKAPAGIMPAVPEAPADIPDQTAAADNSDSGTPLTESEFLAEFGKNMPVNDVESFTVTELKSDSTQITAAKKLYSANGAYPYYTFSCDYIYQKLTKDEKTFWDELTLACDQFSYSRLDYPACLNSRGIGYLPFGAAYRKIGKDRAILLIQLFMYSNPQYYFIRPGCTWSNGYIAPNIITDFFKYSDRRKCQAAIDTVTGQWMRKLEKMKDPVEKERYIIERIAAKLTYNKDAAARIKGNSYTDGYDQTIAGSLYKTRPVCAAYAQTAAYFCNAAGLPCFSVSGNGHQWNVVKILGNWYQLDLTWYDTASSKESGEKWINRSYAAFKAQDPNGSHIYDSSVWKYIAPPECKYTGILYPDPTKYNVMVKGGSIYKGEDTLDDIIKLIDNQKNSEASYVITFNKTMLVKSIKFPKYASVITLSAASGAHIRTDATSISPKCSLTVNCSIVNSKGKNISIKVPKNSYLTISKSLTNVEKISGLTSSGLIVNAALSAKTIGSIGEVSVNKGGNITIREKGKFTAKGLFMQDGGNIGIAKNAQLKVTDIISGSGTPTITLNSNCKPIEITAKQAYGKIYLKSSKTLTGKHIVTARKVDPNLLFDITGIIPKSASTSSFGYAFYVKNGKATVMPFKLKANGRRFAYWNDMIDYIEKSSGNITVELLGNFSIDGKIKLPSKKFKGSLTINGNSHSMSIDNASTLSLNGSLTLKSITFIPHKGLTLKVPKGITLSMTGVKATSRITIEKNGGKVSGSVLYV